MKSAVLSTAMLLTLGSAAHADDIRPMRVPLRVLAVAGGLDIASMLTSHGNYEQNPVLVGLNGRVPLPGIVGIGAGIEVGVVWALNKAIAPRHPRLAKALAYGAAGLHGSLAVKNWSQRSGNLAIRNGGR